MPQNRETILIIDDTVSEIKILADLLRADYATIFAKDGPTGLDMARTRKPDLILLDILMPDMDGREVYTRLKADPATAEIPVIFVTALGGDEHELKGLELGAIDYIAKPFVPAIVRARIRNHLAMHAGIRLREDIERMIQHDMRNPLSAILAMSEILLAQSSCPATEITAINACAYRLLNMLNASLDMYAMETGAYQSTARPVDLALALRKAVQVIHLQYAKQVDFAVTVDGQPDDGRLTCRVLAEDLLCYSLCSNLLQNAFDATPEGGTVHVALAREGGRVRMAIRNPGAVPAAIRDRFFDKYVTAGKEKGTGLGTYIARLIVRTLNGDISMATSEEGGTTITVDLPGPGLCDASQ